jgi:hypothetical protein
MKNNTIAIVASLLMLVAGAACAQTARLGDLKPSSIVVTNEQAAAGVSNALAPRIVVLEGRTNGWNAAVTNGQTSVTIGLASGTTCATATQTNEPVTLAQLESAVNGLLTVPLYGATNIHPVLGAGYFSFHTELPTNKWTNTYTLGTSYALVGNRFDTNSTAGGTTITALSEFDHHVYCSVDALNGGTYYSRVVYVKSDKTATQEIYSGTEVIPATSIRELTSSSTAPTNITLGAGTWYLGVERYAKRNAGATVTLSIYGGGGTPTRLEIPSSLSPSGTFATRQYVDSSISSHTNLTLAGGAHGGLPTPAAIGAMSNTAAAIAAAGGVATNQTDITLAAGWRLYPFATSFAYIKSIFPVGKLLDASGKSAFSFCDGSGGFVAGRYYWNLNEEVVATAMNEFRVGPQNQPDGSCELPVYQTLTNHTALIDTKETAGAANSVSNVLASPYQPWTATLTPPASGGTTLVTLANGTLPLLVCTGAQTVAVNPAGGWGAGGVNRFTLGLYIGSFSVTIATNGTPSGCNIRWGNTLTLSTTRTNQLLYRSVGTNDWVVYGSL